MEIDLLKQLGTQVAIAIQQAKYHQLAALNANNEASLRASEEQLRTLINATPDVICFKDGAGRWLESNQANLVFLDLKGVDYKGKTDCQLAQFSNFYKQALLCCSQTDEQAWQYGSSYRVEEIVPRPDGTISIYDIIKVPLFHPDGRRKGLVVLGRDISELKRVEEALQNSVVQYRDLVQTANCIILRWDTNSKIKFISDYGQRLFGFAESEIINRNLVGTIVSQTETSGRDLQTLMVDICQQPEKYLFNENENTCKNGDRVWIAWANKPILDQQGNLVEILSVGTDATDRKQLEEDLLHRAQVESLLSSISRQFIDQELDTAINFTLKAIAQFFGAERSYIFEYSEDHSQFHIIHEWLAPSIQSLPASTKGAAFEVCLFNKSILSGNVIHIPNVKEISFELAEKKLFESQSIQSVVAVPMTHASKVVGFLGLDVVHFAKTWS